MLHYCIAISNNQQPHLLLLHFPDVGFFTNWRQDLPPQKDDTSLCGVFWNRRSTVSRYACVYRDGTMSKWADRVWAQSGKQNEGQDLIMLFSGNETRTGRRALCFHLLCRLKMFLWWTCVTFTTFWTINEKQLKKNCFPHVVPVVLNPGPRNREACLFWASMS